MELSLTECPNAGVVMLVVPVRLPCPMARPGTLYSANWSISALVRMKSKKPLIC